MENHPFYLDPNTPPEGVVVADMLREKYGREPKEMWERVEGEARKSGIALDLSKQPRSFPTQKAHTIIRLAKPKGTQHALANAITAAYFLEHRQVNEDAVLAEIASGFGFTREEALADMHDLHELADQPRAGDRRGAAGHPGRAVLHLRQPLRHVGLPARRGVRDGLQKGARRARLSAARLAIDGSPARDGARGVFS